MIDFVLENQNMEYCREVFNRLDPAKAILMTHYDLAAATEIKSSSAWKSFLNEPRVKEWIEQEVGTIREVQMRKVVSNAANNEKSVGVAQMLTALNKIGDNAGEKSGNVFIYSYVPLNDKEKNAPNTYELKEGF